MAGVVAVGVEGVFFEHDGFSFGVEEVGDLAAADVSQDDLR